MIQQLLRATVILALCCQQVLALDVLGYYSQDESFASMKGEAGNWINQVSFDQFVIDSNGVLRGSVSRPALRYAASKNFKTFICVSNFGTEDFDGRLLHLVLRSTKNRARLINQLVAKAKKLGFTGVNIDFESVLPQDRARLTSFMNQLSSRLHANGLQLMMSVPAMSSDDPTDGWSGAFDYAALGQAVDILQVMTYDENGPWSLPGPVAGLDWVKDCIEYAISVVNPSKISMGVAAYAYDWNLDTCDAESCDAVSVNQADVEAILPTLPTPSWDAVSSTPYVEYTKNGQRHVMWFDNSQSLALKGDFARDSGIGGVSIWALYRDTTGFWTALLN